MYCAFWGVKTSRLFYLDDVLPRYQQYYSGIAATGHLLIFLLSFTNARFGVCIAVPRTLSGYHRLQNSLVSHLSWSKSNTFVDD